MKKKTLLQSSGFVTLFASLVCIAIGLLFGFLVLLLLGGAMVLFGVWRGEAGVVLSKAIRLCMECVGIG